MSWRIVAFPYIPPAEAPFPSDAYLSAQSGDRLRIVRRGSAMAVSTEIEINTNNRKQSNWAIVEVNRRLGLFPLELTRNEVLKQVVKRVAAAKETGNITTLSPEENIAVDIETSGDPECVVSSNTISEDNKHETLIPPPTGNTPSCSDNNSNNNNSSNNSITLSESGMEVLEDIEEQDAKKEKGIIHSMRRDYTLAQYEDDVEATQARLAAENEEEIITQSRLRRISGKGKIIKFVANLQNTGQQEEEQEEEEHDSEEAQRRQQLREQYVELSRELAWLSQVTENIEAERQRLREVRTSNIKEQQSQQETLTEELDINKRIIIEKKSDIDILTKCIHRLKTILKRHTIKSDGGANDDDYDNISSSLLPDVCNRLRERDLSINNNNNNNNTNNGKSEDDSNSDSDNNNNNNNSVEELIEELGEEELAQDPETAAEVKALRECISHEDETLRDYAAQRKQLLIRIERLKHIQNAIEEESHDLQESEEALAVVAPEGTYTIIRTNNINNNDNNNNNNNNGDGLIIEVEMQEGFVWPATLPGLTTEEQDAANNYQRIFQKYEGKRQQLQRDEEEKNDNNTNNSNNKSMDTENSSSPSVLEKLRKALKTGDAALSEVLQRTEEVKAFVAKYTPVATTIKEQIAISEKVLQRQQEKCNKLRAAYEAAMGLENSSGSV